MDNRSEYPAIARLLPAAIFTFRIALVSLMLILPAAAAEQPGGTPAPAARAEAPGEPALILSLASYGELRGTFLYLARLAGQDDAAARLDAVIGDATGGSGLDSIDQKKPFGAYAFAGAHGDDGSVVLLVPLADQGAFLDLLGHLNIAPRKGDDGVYSASVDRVPEPVYFRFANGYAYVTARDKRVLDADRLLPPGAVLTGQGCIGSADPDRKSSGSANGAGAVAHSHPVDRHCPGLGTGILSLIVNIDRIPDELKELALGELDLRLAEARERNAPPFETEWQRKFRLATFDSFARSIRTHLYEGGETSLRFDFDRKAGDATLTVSMAGKAGTAMAAAIRDLGQATSTTAGLLRDDAAINAGMNVAVAENERELYAALLDDSRRQVLADARSQIERLTMSTAFDAVMPTLKAGELDWSFNLLGPDSDGLYTFVGGVKVREGRRLENVFRQAPPRDPATEVSFDVDKVGRIGIHRVTLSLDDEARRAFGDNPLYLAFRDDAVFFTAGSRGLALLKQALAVAPVTTGEMMELQIAVSRLAPLNKVTAAQEIARDVFGDDRNGDRLRLTLEGGNALKLRLSMTAKLIEYVSRIGRAMK
jgi:hypothetical protein